MPIARFQMPDGRVARFEVPDGTTPEQAHALMQEAMPKVGAGDTPTGPVKIGKDAFPDTLRQVLRDKDWGTRNIAGAGTSLSNLWEGIKQFAGKGDQQNIANQAIIRDEAPVGAFAGDVALTAAPFALAGNTLKAAGAVGAAYGATQPVQGEQTFGNVATGKAINTALGGGLAAGGQAVANKAGQMISNKLASLAQQKAQNAQRDSTLKAAQEAGLVIPPDMANPSMLNRALTGFAGKLTTQQQASAKNSDKFAALARKELGLPDNVPLSDEVLAAYRAAKSGPYKELSGMGEMPLDAAYSVGRMGPKVTGSSKPQTVFMDEAGNIVPNVPKMPQPEMQRNLLNEVIKGGGISKSELSDMGVEGVKRPGLFRKDGEGMKADDLVEWMQQRGWMSETDIANANRFNPGGAHDMARTMVKESIEGRPVFHPAEDDLAYQYGAKLSDWGNQYGNLEKKNIPGSLGKVDAADAVEKLKDIRFESKSYWNFFNRTGDPKARQVAKAYDEAATSLEQFLERSAANAGRADLVPALREARRDIAKAHTVGKALNDATGTINPKILAKEKYLTGDLKTAADFARAVPKAAQTPESIGAMPGVSPLDFVSSGIFAGAGGAALGPGGLLAAAVPFMRPVVRNMLLSPSYQRAMANPNYTLGLAPRMTGGLLQYSPVGGAILGLNTLGQ